MFPLFYFNLFLFYIPGLNMGLKKRKRQKGPFGVGDMAVQGNKGKEIVCVLFTAFLCLFLNKEA